MSSSSFINEVDLISLYIYSVDMIFILITNLLNICVLIRPNLNLLSCTYYFLSLSIFTILYMRVSPLTQVLRIGFGIITTSTPIGCRLQVFSVQVTSVIIVLMLVFASVDRLFLSTSSVRLRHWSQVHIARRVILIVVILTIIYLSPVCFINHWDYNNNKCVQDTTLTASIFLSSRVILSYIVAPLSMTIFGLLTIRNIRKQTRTVAPTIMNGAQFNIRRLRRTEHQLALMLIIQIGAYVVFSIPVCVTYIIVTFIPPMNTPFITAIRSITIVWQQNFYFLSFFLYIFSGTVYRQELIKMFKYNPEQWRRNIHRICPHFRSNRIDNIRA